MSALSKGARGLAVAGAAAALLLSGVFLPTANAAGEPEVTVTPASLWVAAGEDITISGTGCVAPDHGTAEVLIPFNDGFTATPDESGNWSWTHAADFGSGNLSDVRVVCVKYEDFEAAAAADAGTVSTMALEISPQSFAYAPFDFSIVLAGLPFGGRTGEPADVVGHGYVAGETVTFTLTGHGVDLVVGSGVADENGDVNTTILVPSSVVRGEYTLTATGTSGRSFGSTVTVGIDPTDDDDNGSEVTTGDGGSKAGSMPDLGTDVI